jgi:hypothetical protein
VPVQRQPAIERAASSRGGLQFAERFDTLYAVRGGRCGSPGRLAAASSSDGGSPEPNAGAPGP